MLHDAELFFRAEWNDEKHLIHNSSIITACLGMIENTNLNPEVFIISAWLHDMGKLRNEENHHIESLHYLEKFLEQYPKYKENKFIIEDCIKNHRTKCEPKTISGEIFRLADKVSLHNSNWIRQKNLPQ